jgi:signal transduction histidine kinase
MLDGVVEATPERLSSLREEVLLLNRLVNDLRDITLAEAGGLQLHVEPLNLGELIGGLAEGMDPQATERGVRIQIQVADELPTVEADSQRIAQVVRNLLGNALRYTPSGGTITISADLPEKQGNGSPSLPPSPVWVRVTVADTGTGIPPEELPHIFDRFYRVDRSRTRASGGTGLGLAVARQLVEAHGGRIWAESQPGRGSAFSFTLPASHHGSTNQPSAGGVRETVAG